MAFLDDAEIHTIPVPEGWSVEVAWEAIKNGDELPKGEKTWANILVRGGSFKRIIEK
jgi:hypothetical protein